MERIEKAFDVALVKVPLEKLKVYPVWMESRVISLNVAIPFIALTVKVPLSVAVPPEGSLASVRVTELLALVTRLLAASLTSTVIAGLIVELR